MKDKLNMSIYIERLIEQPSVLTQVANSHCSQYYFPLGTAQAFPFPNLGKLAAQLVWSKMTFSILQLFKLL